MAQSEVITSKKGKAWHIYDPSKSESICGAVTTENERGRFYLSNVPVELMKRYHCKRCVRCAGADSGYWFVD